MFKKHRAFVEKMLFDYYAISWAREDEVFSPFPFYIDKYVFDQMVEASEVLDGVVKKVISRVLENPHNEYFIMGDFPLKDELFKMDSELPDFFWARYDAFQREKGGIFFSEFNYDKPCAQREIVISDFLNPENNPNSRFVQKFGEGFKKFISKIDNPKPRVGILVDPAHYEETHLAYLYSDLLKDLNCEFVIVGGKNFYVEGEQVKAFGQEIDIILRQFPMEYFHEVTDYSEIIRLFREGKVEIINDPRAVIGQAKSLFSYLWEMVEKEDSLLSEKEVEIIKSTIPYTTSFSLEKVAELRENKDKYVLKAVFGRYSEEVYIGKMCTQEEWEETIEYIANSEKAHIIQEFCPIRKESVLKFNGSEFEETKAFANFGVYLTNGQFTGACARWSRDYLTLDYTIWMSPVGIRGKSLEVQKLYSEDREKLWLQISEEAAFEHGFTGGYTYNQEDFLLEGLVLDIEKYEELERAVNKLCSIFKKATKLVQDNFEVLCPTLGISDSLGKLVRQNLTDNLTLLGRMDWTVDSKGNLKLLEFNSETPAGLPESIVLNRSIKEKLSVDLINPNERLGQMIRDCFSKIVTEYRKVKEIKNIGIISAMHDEDWYNTILLYEQVKDLPYNFIIGEVSGLEVKEGQVYLNGEPLDAVYRYYPLDWFDEDDYFNGIIDALNNKTLSINPPSTFISQSKAFFALLWELLSQEFFDEEEKLLIEKYIPKTALEAGRLNTQDYCIKPYFGREGERVMFSYQRYPLEEGNYVYQERIDIQNIPVEIYTTTVSSKEAAYPIIGTYVVGNEFAGIYTRAGGVVTDKWAVFLPTFIKLTIDN